jgi:hypothetical protein
VGSKVRFRPAALLTDEERSKIRRVRDEMYELLLDDEDRRRGATATSGIRGRSSRCWLRSRPPATERLEI